jgi:1-acyl-sn-glycerol-3-phosphate acyltransferase
LIQLDKLLYLIFIIFHHPVRWGTLIYGKVCLKMKVFGKENIPHPPYILCSNHSSHLDGMLLSCIIRHKIRWLITRKHFENRKMRWMYRAMKLIPVNMEGMDSKAVRKSVEGLVDGDVLGIFPEGTRSKDGSIQDNVHLGAAYLAIKGQAPVFPAALKGTFAALPPGSSRVKKVPVSIAFGEPIYPPDELSKANVEFMSGMIMDKIRELFDGLPDRNIDKDK